MHLGQNLCNVFLSVSSLRHVKFNHNTEHYVSHFNHKMLLGHQAKALNISQNGKTYQSYKSFESMAQIKIRADSRLAHSK